jgi:hypothetical protein
LPMGQPIIITLLLAPPELQLSFTAPCPSTLYHAHGQKATKAFKDKKLKFWTWNYTGCSPELVVEAPNKSHLHTYHFWSFSQF